jgi:hypothetical protein
MLKLIHMSRRVVFSILGLIVLVGGVIAGVFLIKQRQQLINKAAVPGGLATVSLFPTSGTFNVGDTFPVSVYFNTSGIAISGITIRLTYPYSGVSPEVAASNISINPVVERSSDWNCPTKTVSAEGGNVLVDIACANVGASGYSNNADTLLATFDLTVGKAPATNPLVLRFDTSQSIITQKSNGQDILNIPDPNSARGVYTISGGALPTNTSAPTTAVTSTPSPTPTVGLTATPTTYLTGTVMPTVKPTSTPQITQGVGGEGQLPSAGFSTPTYVGLGLGIVLIIGSIILAL